MLGKQFWIDMYMYKGNADKYGDQNKCEQARAISIYTHCYYQQMKTGCFNTGQVCINDTV